MSGLVVDLFAGGGGASTGIEAALGRPVDVAINHSSVALAVHEANHPETTHLTADLWDVDPVVATRGRRVWILWASPDCTHHSRAKGGKPREQRIRSLAHVVVEWARSVRPSIIFVENVAEFLDWGPLDAAGYPIPERAGETFTLWRAQLELLGYRFECRVLDASEYGAPTRRRRLFMVARCDGQPVAWPAPTHGPRLTPVNTAASCIDWSLPCPSIFERKKPLKPKTLWRIAQGIQRYVLGNGRPFIVKVNHGGWEPRHEDIDAPLSTVTATRRGHALVAPSLVQTGYGEREGQRARALDLQEPLGTVVAGGQKHALVAAFLAKHYGDPARKNGGGVVLGSELGAPIGTITAQDHHSLAAVALAKFRGTSDRQPGSCDVREPLPTISAGGVHVAEVRAFLGERGVPGSYVVEVDGVPHAIVDIGMRMLQPHELLRAQFGKFAADYDLTVAKTKAAQVRLIGNSVPPEAVEALVRANVRSSRQEARSA